MSDMIYIGKHILIITITYIIYNKHYNYSTKKNQI